MYSIVKRAAPSNMSRTMSFGLLIVGFLTSA